MTSHLAQLNKIENKQTGEICQNKEQKKTFYVKFIGTAFRVCQNYWNGRSSTNRTGTDSYDCGEIIL